MFEPLDLQSPQLAQWLGIIFVIVGGAVMTHARWRQKRAEREAAGQEHLYEGRDSRAQTPDSGIDARFEGLAGLLILALGAAGVVYSAVASSQQIERITSNVQQKYDVEEVEGQKWYGNTLESTVELTDGTVYEGVRITFDPATGEPEISGDWPGLTEPKEND